jgi:hypothetical protein
MRLPSRISQPQQIRVHYSTLKDLATTKELEEILENIEKETVPEIQQVWFSHFLKKARCPRCSGGLRLKGNVLYSDCGWRTRL